MSRVVTSADIDALNKRIDHINSGTAVHELRADLNVLIARVSKLEKADEEFSAELFPRLPSDEAGASDQDGDFLQP